MFERFLSLSLVLAPLVVAGCASDQRGPAAGPASAMTAMLLTDGDGVEVNGAPGTNGASLTPGDVVATGAGSSALIEFSDGTLVQLDEGSDGVRFDWDGEVLTLSFDDAKLKARKGNTTKVIRGVGKIAKFFSWSQFVVEEVFPDRFRVDLLAGGVSLGDQLGEPTIGGGQFLQLAQGGSAEIGDIGEKRRLNICEQYDRWLFVDFGCEIDLTPPGPAPKIGDAGWDETWRLLPLIPLVAVLPLVIGPPTTSTTTTAAAGADP